MADTFTGVKARYLFLWMIASLVVAIVTLAFAGVSSLNAEGDFDALWMGGFTWIFYGSLLTVTGLHARGAGVQMTAVYGRRPAARASARLALVALPMIGIALVSLYVVFAPLSLIVPEFVHDWLFEDIPEFYSAGPPYPLLANVLGISAATVVAPVVEEWFFRGLLLPRWTHRWGPISGVIGSSLVFSVAHADLLGAFLFGVVMCGLYSRYQSLWAPTIVHITNNVIAVVPVVLAAHGVLPTDASLESFRAAWWLPVAGVAMAFPWFVRVRKTWPSITDWRFGEAQESVSPV